MKPKFLAPLLVLALVGGCSKKARVSGTVMDAGTAKPLQGVEVWCTSEAAYRKVVTRTAINGAYKIGLPGGEWLLMVNPRESPKRLQGYFGHGFTIMVYEREAGTADTCWLMPHPIDSSAGVVQILDIGSGYRRVTGMTAPPVGYFDFGYWEDPRPQFVKVRRPYVALARSLRDNEQLCLYRISAAPGQIDGARLDDPRRIWHVYCTGDRIAMAPPAEAGNWDVFVLPSDMPPGLYGLCKAVDGYISGEKFPFSVVDDTAAQEQ